MHQRKPASNAVGKKRRIENGSIQSCVTPQHVQRKRCLSRWRWIANDELARRIWFWQEQKSKAGIGFLECGNYMLGSQYVLHAFMHHKCCCSLVSDAILLVLDRDTGDMCDQLPRVTRVEISHL